jgi:hypothetical protein
MTPNTRGLGNPGEADMVSVTKSDFVHEFEIKCSASDYEREFKNKKLRHEVLKEHDNHHPNYDPGGNYFWFVCTFEPEDVPEYAGLMRASSGGVLELKKAPRLHSEKISDRALRYLERGLTYRYWDSIDS